MRECVRKEGELKRSRRECGEEDGVRPGGTQSLGLHFLQVEESGRQPFEGGVGEVNGVEDWMTLEGGMGEGG